MEVWRLSLSVGRASGYGLAALGVAALATSAQGRPAFLSQNSLAGRAAASSGAATASSDERCDSAVLNTCAPRQPMRALSAKEVELLMGANATTNGTTSHGSCNAQSCHTTATIPPSSPSDNPPITSGPPASSLGGGSPGNAPNADQQKHLEKCAQVYGNTSPNPKFQTNFTSDYGWTSDSLSTGLPLVHEVTTTDQSPGAPPAGGGDWLIISASTFYQQAPFHTDLYMYAYTTPATTVGVLAHEWYHQDNDVPGESDAQRQTNEQNATAAGKAAEAAYNADNGAKCSS